MLADPFVLKSLSVAANTAITVGATSSFVTIDPGAGRSVRKTSAMNGLGFSLEPEAVLTLAHSVSNENKPAVTDRHLMRLDVGVTDKEGRAMNAFAFALFGIPRGIYDLEGDTTIVGSTFSLLMSNALIGALAVNPASAALSTTRLAAFLGGEP